MIFMRTGLLLLFFFFCGIASGQSYTLKENISYADPNEKEAYKKERRVLDIHYPTHQKKFITVVWFHGGGLEGGNKHIPDELKNEGVAVVAPNYRLSPKAKNPAYIDDAAKAVAWVFDHIDSLGGDPEKIFVSGHSAGGYLALMVSMDKKFLAKYNIDANKIRGIIPVSGQTNTHYTIRKERGLPKEIPLVDAFAPIQLARKDLPPMLLITGDRNLEMLARYEENAHLAAVLKGAGAANITLFEMQGFDHNTVQIPACALLLEWVKKTGK